MARDYATIVEFLRSKINAKNKKIKTHKGSLVRDIVIDGPSQEFSKLYSQSESVSLNQGLDTADPEGLKVLGANENKIQKVGVPAQGTVIFFSNEAPTVDITVPINTIVSTSIGLSSSQVSFQTLRTVKMYASLASNYLNSDTGKYEVSVEVECTQAGTIGVVGEYNINTIVGSVSGINGVYNSDATSGGTDEETSDAFQSRIALAKRGNTIGTTDGMLNIVLDNDYVEDAVMTGNGDSLRDEIGAIDIYVKGLKVAQFTDFFTALDGDVEFPFTKLPVTNSPIQVITFSNDAVTIPSYTTVRDTGSVYAGSIMSNDKITWDDPLTSSIGNVYVMYTYNSLIEELQNLFIATDKDVQNTDILVHQAIEIQIDVTFSIKVLDGFDETTVKATIQDNLATFFSATKIGEEIQQSDVVGIIVNTEGVDDVVLPLTTFRSSDSSILQNDLGNLEIPSTSYASTGTITINTVVV